MTKFLKSVTGFVLFLALFYTGMLLLWGTAIPFTPVKKNLNYKIGGYGHMFTRLQEVKEVQNIDILFLGASNTYRGFDVRIFEEAGYKTFNLGSSAQTPVQTNLLLNRYLDRLNPKIVIYGAYPGLFESDGIESTLDLLSNAPIHKDLLKLSLNHKHIKAFNTLLFALVKEFIFQEKGKFSEKRERDGDRYISGGYVEKDISYFEQKNYPKQLWNIDKYQVNEFEKMVDLLKQKGIDLQIIQPPIAPAQYASYVNNAEFDSLMEAIGAYRNFNDLILLEDSSHFYDANHLNQSGVEKFNNALINYLQSEE